MEFDDLFDYTVRQPHMLRFCPKKTSGIDSEAWGFFNYYIPDLENALEINGTLTGLVIVVVIDFDDPSLGAVAIPVNPIALTETEIGEVETAILDVMQQCLAEANEE